MTSLLLSELIVGKMWLYISKLINRGTLQNDQMYSLLYLFWTLLLDWNDFRVSWIVVLKFEYLVPLSSRNPDIYRIIVTVCKKKCIVFMLNMEFISRIFLYVHECEEAWLTSKVSTIFNVQNIEFSVYYIIYGFLSYFF